MAGVAGWAVPALPGRTRLRADVAAVARPAARLAQPDHDRRHREISARPRAIRAHNNQLKVAEKTSLCTSWILMAAGAVSRCRRAGWCRSSRYSRSQSSVRTGASATFGPMVVLNDLRSSRLRVLAGTSTSSLSATPPASLRSHRRPALPAAGLHRAAGRPVRGHRRCSKTPSPATGYARSFRWPPASARAFTAVSEARREFFKHRWPPGLGYPRNACHLHLADPSPAWSPRGTLRSAKAF